MMTNSPISWFKYRERLHSTLRQPSYFAPWRSTNTTILTLRRRTSSRLANRRASCRLRRSTAQLTASKASHGSSHKSLEPISLRVDPGVRYSVAPLVAVTRTWPVG